MPKDRHTVPEERFTIDCSFCGFLTTERTYVAAIETAQRLKLHHKASDEKITIFDRLAQRGVCNTWDINGRCIGYKEWREVPHEPVKGEQTGMLGVPGKVHTQKRPYEAGQMELESYAKYKEAMPSTIDLRKDYDEKAEVEGGMLYRKENIVQVWWEASGKETWTNPSVSEARRNFKEMTDRWQAEQTDLHWKTVAELKQSCSQRGLPTDGSKEDLINRLKKAKLIWKDVF